MTEPQYAAKVLEKIDNGNAWNGLHMGVFVTDDQGERQIGQYDRNYHGYGEATFCPFKLGDRWFALYSKDYTSTRLMSLPDCTDIGGENRHSCGFCPVEYFVPMLCGQEFDDSDPKPEVANHRPDIWALDVGGRCYWPDDKDHPHPDEAKKAAYLKAREESHAAMDAWYKRHPFIERHATFGFVAGCIWGDDSSWKIQFLDLSKAAEGKITRDERFGYIELPSGVDLKDAIDTEWIDDLNAPLSELRVRIALPTMFTLDGKREE